MTALACLGERPTGELVLQDVSFSYNGAVALNRISLRVAPGEIVTLIGSNGAGKTTTAKVIAGALRANAGSIRFRRRGSDKLPRASCR